jgi:hypothetical protein
MNICPWCGCNAINISTHDDDFDQRASFVCAGIGGHRWREGEGPEPVEPEQEPLIILARG